MTTIKKSHLRVEQVCDLPGELGAVPLVDQPQVRSGVAAPRRRLRFTIALWFVIIKYCFELLWFQFYKLSTLLHYFNEFIQFYLLIFLQFNSQNQ